MAIVPCAAAAQPWREAYTRGDYRKAADLMHPIVVDPETVLPADPAVAEYLAVMYARGQGVPRDPVLACSLARFANKTAEVQSQDYIEATTRTARLADEHCSQLSDDDRRVASGIMGCFRFGLQEQVLELGGRRVYVGRLGILLEGANPPTSVSDGTLDCAQQFAQVRAATIEPPRDAAPGVAARHFIEVFAWFEARGKFQRGLMWHVYELQGETLQPVLAELLLNKPGLDWAPPGLPREIEAGLTMQMIRSGHVRWRLEASPPLRGWILLPEGSSEVRR